MKSASNGSSHHYFSDVFLEATRRDTDMRTTKQQYQLRPIKVFVVITNCLLVVQYILGMTINLFYNIPFDSIDLKDGSFVAKTGLAFGYARTSDFLSLQLHWLDACLLIIMSIILFALGIKVRAKIVWKASLLLFLIFSVATVSGAAFIAYAGSNYYSFSMATAFIIASILCVYLLFYVYTNTHRMVLTPLDKPV